jgi:hypothetical protein
MESEHLLQLKKCRGKAGGNFLWRQKIEILKTFHVLHRERIHLLRRDRRSIKHLHQWQRPRREGLGQRAQSLEEQQNQALQRSCKGKGTEERNIIRFMRRGDMCDGEDEDILKRGTVSTPGIGDKHSRNFALVLKNMSAGWTGRVSASAAHILIRRYLGSSGFLTCVAAVRPFQTVF